MATTSITLTNYHFRYSPLQDYNEIRLLSLEPRSTSTRIRCNIEHVKLSDMPQYEALSYMWGPRITNTVVINEIVCHIRHNLWSALNHLRHDTERRRLWIDALCINQQDTNERNHQVTQMGLIYSQAEKVVIWLGISDLASSRALDLLSSEDEGMPYTYYKPADTKIWTELENLTAFTQLFLREYWSRLWIIQEVMLAVDIEIQCGHETCSWAHISWLLGSVRPSWVSESKNSVLYRQKVAMIETIRESLPARLSIDWVNRQVKMRSMIDANPAFSPLGELCAKYGEAKCEDRRDKIFGLHTLAERCCREATPIDYTSSWSEICALVFQHFIHHHSRWDSVVKISQAFQEKLKITAREGLAEELRHCLVSKSTVLSDPLLAAVGYAKGDISFITPPLGYDSRHSWLLPVFTPYILKQFSHINRLRRKSKAQYDGLQHPRATRELDLVKSYADSTSEASCKHMLPGYRSKTHWDDRIKGLFSRLRGWKSNSPVAASFRRLLYETRETVQGTSFQDCRLAFGDYGAICFVPNLARRGDVICQFPASDVVAIVRKTKKNNDLPAYQIIGRGVNFLARPYDKTFNLANPDDMKRHQMTFRLDIPTLQMLTVSSANPDPDFGAPSLEM